MPVPLKMFLLSMLNEIDTKCNAFCYIGSFGLGRRIKRNVHDRLGAQCIVINVLH